MSVVVRRTVLSPWQNIVGLSLTIVGVSGKGLMETLSVFEVKSQVAIFYRDLKSSKSRISSKLARNSTKPRTKQKQLIFLKQLKSLLIFYKKYRVK